MNLLISGHRKVKDIEPVCRQIFERMGTGHTLIVGLAMGTDLIAAEQCLEHTDWDVVGAIPYYGQEGKFPISWKRRYWKVLANERVSPVYVTEGPYDKGALFRRNHWMVRKCDRSIFFMHSEKSGTGHTYRFAKEEGVPAYQYDPKAKVWV